MATTRSKRRAAEYGQAALRVAGGGGELWGAGNCGCDPVSSNLYDPAETGRFRGAVLASLGCGIHHPGRAPRRGSGARLGSGGGI